MKPTLIIFDQHQLLVDALCALLRNSYSVLAAVTDRTRLKTLVPHFAPDLVLAEFSWHFFNGFDFLEQGCGGRANPPLVVLGDDHDQAAARASFEAGARAYVVKASPPSELLSALQEALAGHYYVNPGLLDPQAAAAFRPQLNPRDLFGHPLTPRQFQVLRLIAEGLQTKEVAARLDVSPKTIEFHRFSIKQSLGLHTTAELTRYAVHHVVVPPSLHPVEPPHHVPEEPGPENGNVILMPTGTK